MLEYRQYQAIGGKSCASFSPTFNSIVAIATIHTPKPNSSHRQMRELSRIQAGVPFAWNYSNSHHQQKRWAAVEVVRAALKEDLREGMESGAEDGRGRERPRTFDFEARGAPGRGKVGPKRRTFENDRGRSQGKKDFVPRREFEKYQNGPPRKVNVKSKDVWVNREGTFADKIFDENVESIQFVQDYGRDRRNGDHEHFWDSSDPLDTDEGKERAWPERRAAMVELQTADNLSSALPRIGGKLEITDLNAVLRRFGRLGKWRDSIVLFDWMKEHGKVSAPTYTSFFSVLGKVSQVDKALEAFVELTDREIRSNVYVWNSILSVLVCNGKVDRAFQYFRLMKEEGIEPDKVTYSTMVAGCSKALGGFYKAQELVKEMRERGFRLDSVMYGALINVCAANHMTEEARVTFEEMQAAGFTPNLFHYSSLLNSYALTAKHEEAEKVLEEMKAAGLRPNKVVLNSLMNGYARAKLPHKARKTFEEMTTYGLQPDMISFCSLMDAYSKNGQVKEAQEIFDQMKAAGLKPGSNSYSILISAYGRSGNLSSIRRLSQEIDQIMGCDMDIHLFNSLLKLYCHAGVMNGVMDTLRKMDAQQCSPNRITFHILMAYFCKENMCDLAVKTFQDMEGRGYPANETSYTILIQGFLRWDKVEDALDLLTQMHNRGAIPTKVIYQELILSCLKEKRFTEAQQVFQLMKGSRHVVSQAVLETYLETFAEEGMMHVVKEAVAMMIKAGYKPTQDMWEGLLSKLVDLKRFDYVIKLAEEPDLSTSPETLRMLIERSSSAGRVDIVQRLLKLQSSSESNNSVFYSTQ
ncbi:hypothetical protein R1flu_007754 [Riccia fluitans]|uniref:Pentatricopeptide repeat-containing protein n=1 Tax=Riccia fluitans TaxID=41844 RepID=A0ABD1YZR4_9MARC